MLYECYVDGAARGQGANGAVVGEGAAACVIYENGGLKRRGRKQVREPRGQYARLLGKVTNNEAEYEAVLLGALMCWAAGFDDPIIYSDSELVVKQINDQWRCNNETLLPLLLSVREIQSVFRFRVMRIPRGHVHNADRMANNMLDMLAQAKEEK